jgi:hypothetical protein
MLSTQLTITPEDIRSVHNIYTLVYEFTRNHDKVVIDDPYYQIVFRPRTPEELHALNKLRLRAMDAMNETWQALPKDSPHLLEYRDKAELWVPFPHEIEHIKRILSS